MLLCYVDDDDDDEQGIFCVSGLCTVLESSTGRVGSARLLVHYLISLLLNLLNSTCTSFAVYKPSTRRRVVVFHAGTVAVKILCNIFKILTAFYILCEDIFSFLPLSFHSLDYYYSSVDFFSLSVIVNHIYRIEILFFIMSVDQACFSLSCK